MSAATQQSPPEFGHYSFSVQRIASCRLALTHGGYLEGAIVGHKYDCEIAMPTFKLALERID